LNKLKRGNAPVESAEPVLYKESTEGVTIAIGEGPQAFQPFRSSYTSKSVECPTAYTSNDYYSPYQWTVDEVCSWLETNFDFGRDALARYQEAFRINDIDGDILLTLDERDLGPDELNIPNKNHKQAILQNIASLKAIFGVAFVETVGSYPLPIDDDFDPTIYPESEPFLDDQF